MVFVKDSARYSVCEECGEQYTGRKCPYCEDGKGAATILAMDGAFEEAWGALRKTWTDEPETDEALMYENPELHARRNKMPDEDDPFWDDIDAQDEADLSADRVMSRLFPSKKGLGARGKEGINAILNLLGLRGSKQ